MISLWRMSQNILRAVILRAPKGARHSCEVVSPLTDPLVHWPEGAHPILGEAATGHSANKGEVHLLALSFCKYGL